MTPRKKLSMPCLMAWLVESMKRLILQVIRNMVSQRVLCWIQVGAAIVQKSVNKIETKILSQLNATTDIKRAHSIALTCGFGMYLIGESRNRGIKLTVWKCSN